VNGVTGALRSSNASPNHSPTTTDNQGFLVEVMGPVEEFKVQKFKVQGGERGNVEHGTLNL
jgi:hypothetical protein